MNKIAALGPMLGLFLGFSLAAPADPLVQFPTGNSAWTVAITYAASPLPAGTPAPAPHFTLKATQIEVTQVEELKRIRLTWTNGTTTERWALVKFPVVFSEDPQSGFVTPTPKSSLEAQREKTDLPYDASSFSWLDPRLLQEKTPISYQGRECFHYKGSVNSPSPMDAEAWIDSKTLLPVALNLGTARCTFTFQAKPPTGPLVMPPKFQKAVAYYKAVMGYE